MKLIKKNPDIILAKFDGTAELIHAAEKIRDAGYKEFDCHSPFPIHGMDDAMGLKPSIVGKISGIGGLFGMTVALLMQWWTSAIDYPLIISGKPLFSLPAFIPVTFALTILFAAFGAVFGMFAVNKMPQWHHTLFNSKQFEQFSDGGFFVSLEASDEKYNEDEVIKFMESIGGKNIEVIKDEA